MEKMSSTGEDERLDMWQPFQEQLLSLVKSLDRYARPEQRGRAGEFDRPPLGPKDHIRNAGKLRREESVRVG